MFFVQGFSQYMSLPALAALIAAVACQFGPVAISTASISLRSSSSRKSRIHAAVLVAVFFIDHFLDGDAASLLDVAHRHELHVLLLEEAAQVVGSPVADADSAHHDPLAGGDRAVPAQGRAGNDLRRHHRGAGRKRGLQKPTPMKMRYLFRHDCSPDRVDRQCTARARWDARMASLKVYSCGIHSSTPVRLLHGKPHRFPELPAEHPITASTSEC